MTDGEKLHKLEGAIDIMLDLEGIISTNTLRLVLDELNAKTRELQAETAP